ncbi:MAG TPA: hypothetical protein PKW95_23175 [bacterium]|nr:hypothetical protein [bacterium]
MLNVRLDPGAQDVGFASMLTDLMVQNVEQNPARRAIFNAMRGSIALEVMDAEVALTLDFLGGELVVYDGVKNGADVVVSADSSTVLDLSNVKLLLGMPDVFDASGRAVVKKLLSGEVKLRGRGLLNKPGLLPGFNKLLSVRVVPVAKAAPGWLSILLWPLLITALALTSAFLADGDSLMTEVLGVLAGLAWLHALVRFSRRPPSLKSPGERL